ncbi:MAG: hypothetical protein P1P84_20300 [Deferrisomatales bacterium]|nr:hypothetical protein [Deferrisomatales bacterium]
MYNAKTYSAASASESRISKTDHYMPSICASVFGRLHRAETMVIERLWCALSMGS